MKLSKLYTNNQDYFQPIKFGPLLNVVLAEIRLPENKDRDTHNLGKTTLGSILDFCLLAQPKNNFFLFRHSGRFSDLVFFLELVLENGDYVTLKRSVNGHTLISFKYHKIKHQDFTTLDDTQWDHHKVTFEKAKVLLDGLLDWRGISPWTFRKIIGYLLRTQDDYREVFQLKKFQSKHIDWKPFLAHLLGFDGQLIEEHYKKEADLADKQKETSIIQKELEGATEGTSKLEGLLLLKRQELDKKQNLLDAFDFRSQDKNHTKVVVENIDVRIAELNSERYRLSALRRKLITAIQEEQIFFNPEEAKLLFGQAGVLFDGQIKRDFEQLLEFNQAITLERSQYLTEDLSEIERDLKDVNTELNSLGKKRSEALAYLSTTDIIGKYKQITDELVVLKAEIAILESRKDGIHKLQEMRKEIRTLTEDAEKLRIKVEKNVDSVTDADSKSLFSAIRIHFSEIIDEVLSRKALLQVYINEQGHLEFKADILDDTGNTTSADLGNTYKKLLCVAFDLALMRSHLHERFPRFIYHDGVFENLDPRKKEKMLHVLRSYTQLGLQSIVTLLDSDIPPTPDGEESTFLQEEIVLLLHDDGDNGRLFKGPSW